MWTSGNEITDPEIFMLRQSMQGGLSDNPGELRNGRSSGYHAIDMAALAGAARIILLGYDGRVGTNEKMHWFGDHPVPSQSNVIAELGRSLRQLAKPLADRGIEVLNASPGSAVDAFPRVTLDEALQRAIEHPQSLLPAAA